MILAERPVSTSTVLPPSRITAASPWPTSSRSLKNPTGGSTAKPSSDLLRAGGADARNGEEAGDDADAAVPRSGSAGEGPAAEGEGAGGRGAARAVAGIRREVQRGGPALDPAGGAAEGVARHRRLF